MRFPSLRITTDFIGVHTEAGKQIAMLDSEAAPDSSTEESLAFATLFATAPYMLHVLEDAETAIKQLADQSRLSVESRDHPWNDTLRSIRAAIRKARRPK